MKTHPILPLILLVAGSVLNAERVYEPQYNKPLDPAAMTGATINEAEATVTVYVNSGHPAASDGNTGLDPELPLLTFDRGIDAALEEMESENTGVKVFIANGTYSTPEYNYAEFATSRFRRGLTLNQQQNLLIVEGESRGGVVIDATERIEPEAIQDLGDGLYGFSWTRNFGYSKILVVRSNADPNDPSSYGGEIAHRLEALTINGERLEPVILEPHELQPTTFAKWIRVPDGYLGREGVTEPGTFGVSELEEDMIFFRPPEGVDVSDADIRIGVGMSVLELREKSNIVIRNLVIRGVTQPWANPRGAITLLGYSDADRITNVLIEDIEIYNQSTCEGMWIALADNVTLRRIIIRDGGGNGISGGGNKNVVFEDLDFSKNNWRTWMGGIPRWIAGGLKFLFVEDLLANRFIAYGNEASGFWLDTEIENAVVNELYAVNNSVFGFYNEKNFGQVLAENGVWMNNGRYGLHQAETGNTILRSNIMIGNGESPIGFRVRDFWTTDPTVTDQKITQDIVLENNMLVTKGFQPIFNYEGSSRIFYQNSFVPTFSGSNNLYWSPSFNKFVFYTSRNTDFAGWLEDIPAGEDAGSVYMDPGIDPSGDGLSHFFLFENTEAGSLDALESVDSVNGFAWDMVNERPVLDMPLGWRNDAAIEAHFLLQAVDSGTYTFVLNSNVDAAVYLSSDDSLNRVSPEALALSGTASAFRNWEDPGNGSGEVQLEAGQFYHVLVRGALAAGTELPFLSLGWNAPWMETGEVRPVAAPYIRSASQLPVADAGFLGAAVRHVNDARSLEGFGTFWNLGDAWRYHAVHRFLYIPDGQSLPGFWGYSQALGWTYFNQSFGEQWIYSNTLGSWVFSPGWPGETTFYYVYSGPSEGWISFP